jgi:hypothetical protein
MNIENRRLERNVLLVVLRVSLHLAYNDFLLIYQSTREKGLVSEWVPR